MFIKNTGKHSVVFVNYNQVKMEGINTFIANTGPSIRVRIRLALVLADDIAKAYMCQLGSITIPLLKFISS